MKRVLVYGLGVAGRSSVAALVARGYDVVATDDRLDGPVAERVAGMGAVVVAAADAAAVLDDVGTVVPAPGVPETHPIIHAAADAGCALVSEIELAYRFERQRRGRPRPMLAVTGTDGKTTTTLLATAMLEAAGRHPVAAGNTEVPLLDAIELAADCFVVEAASFRLAWTEQFRSEAAVWLNLAPDHLNWHVSMDSYEAAKARIFELQRSTDVAVGNACDPVVMRHLRSAPGRQRTFGLSGADYRLDGSSLVGPDGELVPVEAMRRGLPHDITNALAAAALVIESGLAGRQAVAEAVATFVGPPHRLELVTERHHVRWFDDSKATTPHAAGAALAAFQRVVLIAGGMNKGLDLSPLAQQAHRLRAVVAIGQDAGDVAALFEGGCPVATAGDMATAVRRADAFAQPGDVVLLSPACASFDWYESYAARGDDFRRCVLALDDAGANNPSEQGAPT